MSLVVPDQFEKFEKDELFINLKVDTEIRYSNHLEEDTYRRQQKFLDDCNRKSIDIVFTESGINMNLTFNENNANEDPNNNSKSFLVSTNDKVQMNCEMVLNGVCVIFRGWIGLPYLKGFARLEFDKERAEIQTKKLRDQLMEYHTSKSDCTLFQQNMFNSPFPKNTLEENSCIYERKSYLHTVSPVKLPIYNILETQYKDFEIDKANSSHDNIIYKEKCYNSTEVIMSPQLDINLNVPQILEQPVRNICISDKTPNTLKLVTSPNLDAKLHPVTPDCIMSNNDQLLKY